MVLSCLLEGRHDRGGGGGLASLITFSVLTFSLQDFILEVYVHAFYYYSITYNGMGGVMVGACLQLYKSTCS